MHSDITQSVVVSELSHDQPRSFEDFLHEQRESLVNFLWKRTKSREDAEDAAQESLVRLMRYRESQPASAWKPLLYRIASNVANDQLRHAHTHHAAKHDRLDEDLHNIPSESQAHDERVAQQQELVLIKRVILRLPPRCQEVYLLNRMDDMSYSEIAKHLGISNKAVEKHIAKALIALRKELGASGAGTL
jgi:RNA polymerase sigma factor (sigma-70 family)